MSSITVEIINKKGLHARAAAKFVKTVTAGNKDVNVVKLGQGGAEDLLAVAGSSILGLMMLGADAGSKLRIDSEDAEVLNALKELMDNKFGEAE